MLEMGVFLPIGNNGFLISTTSPQYSPTFDLNREIVQRAERYGMEFALSMIKLRGLGGPSRYWDENLESFTLMAGLGAVTERIRLIASVAVLTLPPAIVARMAVTIDSISKGRFGVNIVSGWLRDEYDQMGLWPGADHYTRRYEYCAEYVRILRELWTQGRSDYKGAFFKMDDCRLGPLPQGPIPVVCAGQSDLGTRFAAECGDFNFCAAIGTNEPGRIAQSVERLNAAARLAGRDVGALVSVMVIADETDAAAMAKWDHYKSGTDLEALAYRREQQVADPSKDPYATPNKGKMHGSEPRPVNSGVLIGSYASIAAMLDEMGEVDGVRGIMLSFDDFIIGIEQFGRRIQPLMRTRSALRLAA